MFLLFFLVFTLIFTVFQNILVAGISLVLVIIFLIIYQCASNKKIPRRQIIYSLLGGFLLAGMVFGIKEWRYYDGKVDDGKLFVGTGMIVDISSQGKYIFEVENKKYLLYSKKQYAIGEELRLVGKFQTNSQSSGCSYWTISSGTFAVPIFSGDFDYTKRLKMKGWKGTIYENNSIIKYEGSMKDGMGIIQSMKKSIQEKVISAYGKNRVSGLILGMLIGDKSQIPETEYQQFVDSGLVHLIAVSGGNILMIVIFLQFVLFFLPFYVRIVVILCTIIGYSLICGLDSSVFRAVLMGGLSMVALFRGREINIWRLLSISVIVMLIINPYFLVYDTGFLLSYSALIGIVYFDTIPKDEGGRKIDKENTGTKIWRYVYKNYVSPSIGANLGIFPILVFFMGKINIVSILGNLLVVPIVPFVMIYGFVSVWLYGILGWSRMLWIEQFLVNYIYKISELLSRYGIFFTVSGLWLKYILLAIFLTMFIVRRKRKPEVKS